MTTTHVLVVDDDESLCAMLQIALSSAGFAVDAVHDGASALAVVQIRCPDVVILDVHLPDVDGRDIARAIRADPGSASTAIIYSSDVDAIDDQWELWNTGADSVLARPFELDDLIAELRRTTGHRLDTGTSSAPTAEDGGLTPEDLAEARRAADRG